MTARTTPSPMPSTIAPTVPKIVPFHRPSMTGVCCMISNANGKFQRSLVTNELMTIATTIAMRTTATQRPGCRTGRASMAPGRSCVGAVIASGDRRVHGEVGDRAALGLPLREDLVVGAVGLEHLERLDDGGTEVGLVLGEDVAVGRRVVLLTEQLEGAARGVDRGDGRGEVDEHGVGLAGLHAGGHLGLVGVDEHLDLRLAGVGARLVAGRE